jgi:hypothetical protein
MPVEAYPHCSFTVVIYTLFYNQGIESYRKESISFLILSGTLSS